MHRKLAFSTLAHDTLGIIPLAAGVVTTILKRAKNSVRELIDYTTYNHINPRLRSATNEASGRVVRGLGHATNMISNEFIELVVYLFTIMTT